MKVGDVVELKAGSIKMTVNAFSETRGGSTLSNKEQAFAQCVWIDDNQQAQQAFYSVEALNIIS